MNGFRDTPRACRPARLRLNVPLIVASMILPPIAEGFLKTHPGITLEVTAEDSFIDVLAAGFDAGIRYDERLEQDMIAVPDRPPPAALRRGGRALLSRRAWPAGASRGSARPCMPAPPLPQRRHPALGIRARRRDRPHQPQGTADRDDAGALGQRRRRRPGRDLQLRGIPGAGDDERPACPGARRLVAELLGAVSLLREPATYAGTSAGLCRLYQGAAESQVKAVAYFA